MDIVLVYEATCPHVDEARANLRAAGVRWQEVRSDLPDSPAWASRHGSPTILIDGEDISGDPQAGGCCRVYRDAQGRRLGAPAPEAIRRALGGS